MRFRSVHIESLACALPEERVRSEAIEERLAPVYERLGLSTGRLELMTGIAERRFWPPGTRPSTVAAEAGRQALERAGFGRERIGRLVHASVSRDFLEPATASVVHARLGLGPECPAYDLSNACLGFANAMELVAGQIEHGAIDAGLVVAGEDGRPLVEETVRRLTAGNGADRAELKRAFASLTIGSGAAACVLAREGLATSGHRLEGTTCRADTEHHALCAGDRAGEGGLLMETDAEALLVAGNALAVRTFGDFCREHDLDPGRIDRFVTHQVGAAHRRTLFEALELDPAKDFPTVGFLGNVGSVSLPATLALAAEEGFVSDGHRVAMLGIGSGLFCQMLSVSW